MNHWRMWKKKTFHQHYLYLRSGCTLQMSMCILMYVYKTYITEQIQLNYCSPSSLFKSCKGPLVKSEHAAVDVSDWLKNETHESTSSRISEATSPMFSFCFYRELIIRSEQKLDVMHVLKKIKLRAKVVLWRTEKFSFVSLSLTVAVLRFRSVISNFMLSASACVSCFTFHFLSLSFPAIFFLCSPVFC